jgi:hypothetical protein
MATLCTVALLMALYVRMVPIRFETNDDAAMLLIASGAYTGNPDHHLIFINVIIGGFLSALYKISTQVEFYTLFLLAMHVYATSVIFMHLKNLALKGLFFYSLVALLVIFEMNILAKLQFTTTSGYLALSAIAQSNSDDARQKWLAVLAFFVAAALRFEAAMLVLLLSLPFIIKKEKIFISLNIVVIFVSVALVGKLMDHAYYSNNTQWQEYKAFLNPRININDNPNDHLFKPLNEREKNDYELLLGFLPNPVAFSNDRLKEIGAEIRNTDTQAKINNVAESIFFYELHHYNKLFVVLSIFMLLLIGIHHKNAHQRNRLCLLLFICAAFYVFISLNNVLKLRVFLITMMPVLFFASPMALRDIHRHWATIALSGLLVMCCGILLYTLSISIRTVPSRVSLINEQLHLSERYSSQSQKPIFGVAFSPENIDPFQISQRIRGKPFVYGGWLTKAPFPNHLQAYDDLLEMSMLLSKDGMDATLTKMVQSLKDNHQMDVGYRVVVESKNHAIVEFERR